MILSVVFVVSAGRQNHGMSKSCAVPGEIAQIARTGPIAQTHGDMDLVVANYSWVAVKATERSRFYRLNAAE
jgi:hypothetical protein